jgi:hypothetical protein
MIWLEKVSVQNQNLKIKTLKNKLSMQKKKTLDYWLKVSCEDASAKNWTKMV